ncbi:hypothetical protein [endosymbiont 'TC1' of Trimyema compressum]|uniref:hypothetical protein n=1 Tax=endosymbiont 'TC1' of Trimyema compressum TaxID=243899 RepID=UPI00155F45F6|nr:hypothetical protein [endosymbiont 'TC1' of Trimyema compressum]
MIPKESRSFLKIKEVYIQGCPLLFKIMDSALALMKGMGTLDGVAMEKENMVDLRKQ